MVKTLKSTYFNLQVLVVAALFVLLPNSTWAQKRVEKDLNKDGRIDQVFIYNDKGMIEQVEIDGDQDGNIEKRQIYLDGLLIRVEQETDNHKKVDYFKNEKRIQQDIFSLDKQLLQVSIFDAAEHVSSIKKDTTKNNRFDTYFYFNNAELISSTRDTNGNGRINVWTSYTNTLVVKQEYDHNEDGIMDRIVNYDSKGRINTLYTRPFKKGNYREHQIYKDGEIKTRQLDMNEDGKPDIITRFENACPVEEQKDTNFDGQFDVSTWFINSRLNRQEKDLNFDGKKDYYAQFDTKGQLLKICEDTTGSGRINRIQAYRSGQVFQVQLDHDENGFFENKSWIENKKIIKNLIDKNQDGKPDLKILYDENQQKKSLACDSDFDGYFETLQIYDDPEWSMIISTDVNTDKIVDTRFFYKDDILRQKELDENSDGLIDVVEIYGSKGGLEKIEEKLQGKTTLTWFYDEVENPVKAKEDKNGDGKTDIWYVYENGNLVGVQEDTNLDGKPDLWEEYDKTQTLVKRERDLDFDGTPDFMDVVKETEKKI